ncbi:hypothetical protein AURDEDRAFT_141603 [Auricularia subglabra TFB-10046 SS5]|nr:hypothetical protein AURDEDRAFT_141603 [Auricularia subglabra TFB-10046 SS5]
MPTMTSSFGASPFALDDLNEGFSPHPMPIRRLSSASTSSSASELSIPPSCLQAVPTKLMEIELSPSPSPVDTAQLSSGMPETPSTSPTQLQSSSDAMGTVKKSRAPPRERVSLKDFRPPDVTGLSKREARLVKNRAAAFLSRQRKREEFEAMEIRVGELEKENARLRGHLSSTGRDASMTEQVFHAEMAAMRAQLASTEQRAADLRNELMRTRSVQAMGQFTGSHVKQESMDFAFGRSPSPSSSDEGSQKDTERTATKLGLMVLMSLSSVLSKSATSSWGFPTKFSVSTDPTSDAVLGEQLFGEPQRRAWDAFAGDMNVVGAADAEFDVAFTPSTEAGKTHVRLSMPGRQDPCALPWAMSPSSPEFAFDMPVGMDMGLDAFGQPFGAEGLKKRLRVSMKNPNVAGDWDVEIL